MSNLSNKENFSRYFTSIRNGSYLLVLIGVALGVAGAVRTASLLVAVGAGIFTSNHFAHSNRHRKIEFVLPLAAAFLLFVVALTLPHAK